MGRQSITPPSFALRYDNEYPDGRSIPSTVDNSFADSAGFHVYYPGFLFDLKQDFKLRPDRKYVLGLHNEGDGGYYEIHLATGEQSPTWEKFGGLPRTALILTRPPSPQKVMVFGRLVSVYREDEELFARIQSSVIVVCRGVPASESVLETNQVYYLRARNLKESQKWCAG